MSKKIMRDHKIIVDSLLNLKKELMNKTDLKSREIFFKINSCLFSEYPHKFKRGVHYG